MAVSARPAAHQAGLVGCCEGVATEAAGRSMREAGGRVRQADPMLAGEAEEVT